MKINKRTDVIKQIKDNLFMTDIWWWT